MEGRRKYLSGCEAAFKFGVTDSACAEEESRCSIIMPPLSGRCESRKEKDQTSIHGVEKKR